MASKGLWANIHAKRARGERMRKKGEKGAPTADQIKRAQGEEVEEMIKHNRYMRSHGKKAPAKEIATWMFTTKEMGDVDYDNEKVVWRAKRPMKLAQAGKEAMKALGTKDVYVMEETKDRLSFKEFIEEVK